VAIAHHQAWIELVGGIIIARVRGEVTPELLAERHARIAHLRQDTGCAAVLLDDLEMYAPSLDAVEAQRRLTPELDALGFRIAIVVPNSRLAYLARLQFGGGNHRVFYNDMAAALLWLTRPAAPAVRGIRAASG
jgi:hypothetical protein